jgi:hypothetical protein
VRYLQRYLPLDEINADNVDSWLHDLNRLAVAVDLTGPSDDALEPKRLEEWARTERGKHVKRFLLVLGIVGASVYLALFVFGWLMIGR